MGFGVRGEELVVRNVEFGIGDSSATLRRTTVFPCHSEERSDEESKCVICNA